MKKFFKLYKIYYGFIKKYKFLWLFSWISVLLMFVANNSIIYLTKDLIDGISSGNGDIAKSLLTIGLVMGVPLILDPITFTAKSYVFKKGVRNIMTSLYTNILTQDYSYHINKQTGKLISKALQGQQLIEAFTWNVEFWFLRSLASLVIPLFLLSTLHRYISLTALIAVLVCSPVLYIGIRMNIKHRTNSKNELYKRNNVLIDGISNFDTVRSFGNEDHESTVFDHAGAKHENALWKYQMSFRYVDFFTTVSSIVIFLSTTFMSLSLYNQGLITTGGIVIVVTYLFRFTENLMDLFFKIRAIMTQIPILDDIADLLELEPKITDSELTISIDNPKGEINFKDVVFGYSKNLKVLKDLDLSIKASQTVAFVGPSGGGKSTAVKLLMRYYEPESGNITIDGINVNKLSYKDLRNLFGLVPQEPVLFNRTIFENVAYSLNLESDKDYETAKPLVEEACKNAEIHDFIMTLPRKYKTKVGERGLKLSGGQKQRIAIARVILKDPQIVIFDEATSMLDSESEQAIQKAFRKLSKDKTTIVIAHRLSTITNSDKIFVIDEGEITESGNHQELLDINGEYAKLWKIQSGGFIKG
jgi:ATP-binding cassette, subfamily B, heavy metal transporter